MQTVPCFPFFVQLEGKEGLIVGGSAVALRKVTKLRPYGARLTVCAPQICTEIREMPGLVLEERPFSPELLSGKMFVVAATNNREINAEVSRLSRERGILVNVVDDRELCGFVFPALVREGPLSVGICTGGASPTAAAWLKKRIESIVPENFGELLEWLDDLRGPVKEKVCSEAERRRLFTALFAAGLENGGPLSAAEAAAFVSEFGKGQDV